MLQVNNTKAMEEIKKFVGSKSEDCDCISMLLDNLPMFKEEELILLPSKVLVEEEVDNLIEDLFIGCPKISWDNFVIVIEGVGINETRGVVISVEGKKEELFVFSLELKETIQAILA